MDQNFEAQSDNHIELTVDIVAAYVSNNSLPAAGLADLIASVHGGLVGLRTPAAPAAPAETEKPTAAQIRKSITPDGLVSFVDGKMYKTLKRHLTGAGLDPVSYRKQYGLPNDYPMVAASYAAARSALAKSFGLGQQRRTGPNAAEKVEQTEKSTPEQTKKGRGRPRKAAEADAAEQQD